MLNRLVSLNAGEPWPLWQQAILYFGSFNPVHNAHLFWAEQAREQLGKTHVLWLPSGRPPNRNWQQLVPFEHRLNMLALALAEKPEHWLCPYEGEREPNTTPTYTFETLKAVCGESVFDVSGEGEPKHSKPVMLVGEETLLSLPSWHQADVLAENVHFVVAPRQMEQGQIKQGQKPNKNIEQTNGLLAEVTYLQQPKQNVSATMLRQRLKDKLPCQSWLHPAVEDYWQTHHLDEA